MRFRDAEIPEGAIGQTSHRPRVVAIRKDEI